MRNGLVKDKGTCVGLDVGTTKVCCIIAQSDGNGGDMKLLGAGVAPSHGVKRGTVVDIDATIQAIEDAVHKAETMANVKVSEAYVGLSGDHIRGLNTQGAIAISKNGHPVTYEDEIKNSDITRVLEMARAVSLPVDREILHILPQEFVVDHQGGIKNPTGMVGRRLEAHVHLITGATSAAKNITKCVEEAGIVVRRFIYQPLASGEAVLEPHEKKLGVVLVDIGGGTTDICVYFEGEVRHSAVIALGGDCISNDLAMMTQVSIDEAEEIKTKYGSAKAAMASTDLEFELPYSAGETPRKASEHEVSRYVEARMTEIFQMVKREIQKHLQISPWRSGIENPASFGVVLTGGGSLLKNAASLGEEILDAQVKIGIPKGLSGVVDVAASPIYATAIGLVQHPTLAHEQYDPVHRRSASMGKIVKNVGEWFQGFF
ncbi:MAG TPA: cell division protein FtsA [Candidatus Marinimicrobia bacterium]|nr:cell division protein FtsA [Candidatus Neomarinimicrobiota bacterium]MDP7121538.1 cell division protein FtsA [Candidatus Neomarinimicrobiota bacterium]MDP7483859.1 cell division protein FtsA [Candidatus Neomarinimicrobiota bacterium]MDP7528735.1 cell division protein FtsA [Candidatus Neomarinimicrobiota bacterium]MDP7716600.1 cell division protein FtsA [Candidatus Neomarinimicrobiota bacterium]